MEVAKQILFLRKENKFFRFWFARKETRGPESSFILFRGGVEKQTLGGTSRVENLEVRT